MIHAFADCELDEELFQLRRRGRVIKLEPKVFDVLLYLLRHCDRVVSKDELLDAVWPNQAVSESVLPKCIVAARRGVGDLRGRRKVIATIHGRGYRFVAPVAVVDSAPSAGRKGESEGGSASGTPLSAPSFIGRDRAWATLCQALASARGGQGRVVLLAGEPGIGKTRTADELAAEARRQGIVVLIGRCHEGEGAPPFWPWVQILRASVARGASEPALPVPGAAEVVALVPELGAHLGGAAAFQIGEDQQARFRLFDGIAIYLKHASATQPLAVVIDDLHWADEASLRLLGFLASDAHDAALLVVATYRDVAVGRGDALEGLVGSLARLPHCEQLTLRGLEPAEIARLVETLTGAAPPPTVVAAVKEMTEGNPFFIQEIVRILVSEPSLVPGTLAGGAFRTSWMLEVPQSLRAAIGQRLAGLSPAAQELLRTASVLGREFGGVILARASGLAHERVSALLHEATAAHIVDEVSGSLDRHMFHHALIRQALYEELSAPQRILLHRRAGEVLEEALGGQPESALAQLAHHFVQAAPGGDVEKAVVLSTRVAAHAFEQLAYEESTRWYERALQALDLGLPPDEERRGELLLALGEAWSVAGVRDRARATFELAADVARRLQRADLLARAALGYRAAEMGSPVEPQTLALLEEALTLLGDHHPNLRARLLSRLVGTPPHSDSMVNRAALAREAHGLARQTGDPRALHDALSARLWASLGPDGIAERLAVAHELLALAGRQSDKSHALLGQDGLFGAHLLRGDMGAAQRALAAFTRIAHDLRQPAAVFQATFWRGSIALARGELDEAERLFREAMTMGRGTVPYAHFMFAGQMSSIHYRRASDAGPELTRVIYDEMLAMHYSFEPAVRSSLALAHALAGDQEACRAEFDGLAARGFEALRRDEHWLVALGVLSEVAVRLDDRERGAQLYELLRPYAGLVAVHDLLRSTAGAAASHLGDLAVLMGRDAEATAYYEQAIAQETTMGILPALLDTCGGYCRLLFRRREHRRRAEEMLAATESRAAALGIVRYRYRDTLRP